MATYSMTTPCANCPFRKDIRAYLTSRRVREIEHSLIQVEFPCHKTTKHDENGEYIQDFKSEHEIHCAGALILLEKLDRPSQMMRICERIGMYDRRKLDMDAPVFDSFHQMAKAQPRK